MADYNNQHTSMTAEELLQTEIIVNQALIDILIAKQIISEEELFNSIQSLKLQQQRILQHSNKIVSLKR
jgi:hypothetical protein